MPHFFFERCSKSNFEKDLNPTLILFSEREEILIPENYEFESDLPVSCNELFWIDSHNSRCITGVPLPTFKCRSGHRDLSHIMIALRWQDQAACSKHSRRLLSSICPPSTPKVITHLVYSLYANFARGYLLITDLITDDYK